MANIVLLGLEDTLANPLGRILVQQNHHVSVRDKAPQPFRNNDADLVFCSGEDQSYREALKTAPPGVAFIVVTRLPETSKWLDALEAGATDYCSTPFEALQIRWLIDSALRPQQQAA